MVMFFPCIILPLILFFLFFSALIFLVLDPAKNDIALFDFFLSFFIFFFAQNGSFVC